MGSFRRLAWVVVGIACVLAPGSAGSALAAASGRAPLVVVDSVVEGHANVPRERVCVLNSRFLHGEMIVWRVKVIDPLTGSPMDDKQLKRVWVELADGRKLEASYGPHPKTDPTDYFWATSWVIPAGYPSGVLDYTVYAEAKDGRTGESVKFDVESSALVILPGSAGS